MAVKKRETKPKDKSSAREGGGGGGGRGGGGPIRPKPPTPIQQKSGLCRTYRSSLAAQRRGPTAQHMLAGQCPSEVRPAA